MPLQAKVGLCLKRAILLKTIGHNLSNWALQPVGLPFLFGRLLTFMLDSAQFEEKVRKFLTEKYRVSFEAKKIKIKGVVEKNFDLVASDGKHIGDAKFYKSLESGNMPSAKRSTIAEYVWLLEKTNAKHKFLVFGRDEKVPIDWLKRFGSLTNVKFYFFSENRLEELN